MQGAISQRLPICVFAAADGPDAENAQAGGRGEPDRIRPVGDAPSAEEPVSHRGDGERHGVHVQNTGPAGRGEAVFVRPEGPREYRRSVSPMPQLQDTSSTKAPMCIPMLDRLYIVWSSGPDVMNL